MIVKDPFETETEIPPDPEAEARWGLPTGSPFVKMMREHQGLLT